MRKQKKTVTARNLSRFLKRRGDSAVVLLEVWLALITQQSGVFLPVVSYYKDKSEVTSYVREHTHFHTVGKMCMDTDIYGHNISVFTKRRS